MATNGTEPTLVIVQLSGGNDFMNTVIPYGNSLYYDFRPVVGIPEDNVLPIDGDLGFNPNFAPVQDLYDGGDVAIIQGVGYPDSSRSHFRSMDIWHTCEPNTVATEGWLGKAVRELDPDKSNPLTAVSFGRGLPRALVAEEVTVTSVGDLETYGLMNGIEAQNQREDALDLFKRIYTPAIGSGPVTDYLARTGIDVLRGADQLKRAPEMYESTVEYASNPIATSLRDVARVHLADLGTRVFYTQQGGYDTHANEVPTHPKLLTDLSGALGDFFDDLREHDADSNVVVMVFTEFGRRREGQQQRHRSRCRGRRFRIGQAGKRRSSRRIPVARSSGPRYRRPTTHQRLPGSVCHGPGRLDGYACAPDRRRQLRETPPVHKYHRLTTDTDMVASKQKQQKRPFGPTPASGSSMKRPSACGGLTNTPIAVVLWEEGDLLILCRGEGLCFVRRLSFDDEDKGAFNLTGGGGPVGGGFKRRRPLRMAGRDDQRFPGTVMDLGRGPRHDQRNHYGGRGQNTVGRLRIEAGGTQPPVGYCHRRRRQFGGCRRVESPCPKIHRRRGPSSRSGAATDRAPPNSTCLGEYAWMKRGTRTSATGETTVSRNSTPTAAT